MNMFTATMPIWIALAFIIPLALLVIAASIVALQFARRYNRQIDDATRAFQLEKERNEARSQRDELNRENESLHSANKRIVKEQLDLHKKNTALQDECEKWTKLYGELLNELHDASPAATVPMQDAITPDAPLSYAEAKPAIDKAAQSTKRPTRKKAGQA